MRRLVGLAFPLLIGLAAQVQAQPGFLPQAEAYLILADGKALWARNADKPLPPASLTKLMTAILVLEHKRLDDVVTVSRRAAAESGSRLGLKAGDRLTVRDLLAAALIQSANDACRALADSVAGSAGGFVALMNQRAEQLNLDRSHFANACGHDQPGHYASARDLAELGRRALAVPTIAALVALPSAEISTSDGRRHFTLSNKNALIGRYPGALGVKSGYTRQAGKCLVAAAKRNGHSVLLVFLNAPNRWWDASDSLDRAFAELAQRS